MSAVYLPNLRERIGWNFGNVIGRVPVTQPQREQGIVQAERIIYANLVKHKRYFRFRKSNLAQINRDTGVYVILISGG